MTTQQTLALLRAYESPNVTYMASDGSWPIVWKRARGVHVWDAQGKKYLDLTAAFGVAAAGHANPRVVKAGQLQMATLLHAMGDVHPHELKARLAQELSRKTFEQWSAAHPAEESKVNSLLRDRTRGKTIFCNSGFEAVEAALKTAMLATDKPGVIAFTGAYHGLGYGALNATHRGHFRSPFVSQLREFGAFVTFPTRIEDLAPMDKAIRALLHRGKTGAILVEPIQVRGGINIPPPEFLPMLRRLCDEHKVVLILDEIYTGFGRTGKWFACDHSGTVPDVICLGKALTGGFPLSACVGRAELMDAAWPVSQGEAMHTSTFLGHPVGCAMALAQLKEIEARKLIQRSATLGHSLLSKLAGGFAHPRLRTSIRGLGLLAGIELRHTDGSPATQAALTAIRSMLHKGFILLPEAEHANVISLSPPLTISESQLETAIKSLKRVLNRG
jgi:4-aminobutyrate aminotransferase-like enzyme